jgi:glycine dehydrogenase subunit 1
LNPYIANTPEDVSEMLSAIGAGSIADLFKDIQPAHAPRSFDVPPGRSELEVARYVRSLARQNASGLILFTGGGYYDHYIPAAVPALAGRGEFFTAYTPYQPECAQGTLQALYEYQSGICALTGMDASNASLYDGGTALYEAAMMAVRLNGRTRIVVDGGVNPIFLSMLRSYTRHSGIECVEAPPRPGLGDRAELFRLIDERTAAVIVQNPNFFGAVDDHTDIAEKAHACGAVLVQSVYPIALGLLKSPGETGADIAVGEGQPLGLPLSFGGPYLGFMAVKKNLLRKMPGRIVGQTIDAEGRRCFVNTLQAREQHIRREKASSNICTNAAFCAVQAAIYMSLLGRQGIRELAQLNLDKAAYLKKQVSLIPGVEIDLSVPVFNEFTVRLPGNAGDVVRRMIGRGFAAGFPLGRYDGHRTDSMVVAVTEKRTRQEMDAYAGHLKECLHDRKEPK